MSKIISVHEVKRVFRSVKKSEGLGGAFKLLVKPEIQEHEALKKVSFDIESGAFVGLIGANGAGKTTLLKILSGLIPPTSGEARVMGFVPFERKIEFRKKIALLMGQKAQLWWDLPAIDAFELIRAIYEIPDATYRERVKHLSEILDVTKLMNTQIRRLSLGERMKMELIGAILHWPSVIFLDEPTIGLDVLAAHRLREFLREFNEKEKATIILTSHNMDDIQRLCSRVMILRTGELIYDGKPEGLIKEGECRLKVQFKLAPSIEELKTTTNLDGKFIVQAKDVSENEEESEETEAQSVYFTVAQKQIAQLLHKLMDKYQIVNMGIEEQSLESVIQRLYENNELRVSL